MKEFTELKDLQDLLLFERTYTGATQTMFAQELSYKYENKISLGQLNGFEHAKKKEEEKKNEMSLEDVLRKEFYHINIRKEKELVSLAYKIVLTFIQRNISIDVEELFSCTTKNDLIDFICKQMTKESPLGIKISINEEETKKSIQDLMNEFTEEGVILSETVDITPIDVDEKKFQVGFNLNDTAKLIFYIGYYYLLLSHKEVKNIITKEDLFQQPEEFARICHIDIQNKKDPTAISKYAKNINMRVSLYIHIQDRLKEFIKSSLEAEFPEDGGDIADVVNSAKKYYKSINTIESERPSPEEIEKIYSRIPTLRDYIIYGFAFYQGEAYFPCSALKNAISEKFKKQQYFASKEVKNEISVIVKDLKNKYPLYEKEPTPDLFVQLVKKQRYLFQLYKKLNALKSIKEDL